MKNILCCIGILLPFWCFGQQLKYTPKNPAFGGSTFNYQWLLSSATAQNSFQDPSVLNNDQTELEQFQESLNRQLLGQLTRSIFNAQLGEGLQVGTFTIGDLALEIFDTSEGRVINILDTSTGEQTQIIIPN